MNTIYSFTNVWVKSSLVTQVSLISNDAGIRRYNFIVSNKPKSAYKFLIWEATIIDVEQDGSSCFPTNHPTPAKRCV